MVWTFYEKYLDAKEIESRRSRFGFPDPRLIELLIYDYEIFRNLIQHSEKFYLKGGAAAQLYMNLPEQRASKDIDLVTDHTPEEVEKIFAKLNATFPCRKHTPVKITRKIPMITYMVTADSVVEEGGKVEVKVDIMFECIKNYRLVKAQPSEIFALNTEVELPSISPGSLVGDKFLTLARKSIGLPAEKLSEYPKQLYDLSRIMHKLDKENFADMMHSFGKIIKTELEIRELENTPEEIISHIFEVLGEFCKLDSPECMFKNHLNDFQSAYVNSKARKSNSQWINDSLMLVYLLKLIRGVVVKNESIEAAYEKWTLVCQELKRISSSKVDERRRLREKFLDDLREKVREWKKLKSCSEERLFMELKCIEGEKMLSLTDKLALDYLDKIETFESVKSLKPEDRNGLKDIMKRYISEKLTYDQFCSLIRSSMPYIKPYIVKFIANTEPKKIYTLATLENLRRKGEQYCYVNPSGNFDQCPDCQRLIDGRVFKIQTLADNVYSNYREPHPIYPSVPLHSNCRHEVRGLSSEEKEKLPESIPSEGFKIKF